MQNLCQSFPVSRFTAVLTVMFIAIPFPAFAWSWCGFEGLNKGSLDQASCEWSTSGRNHHLNCGVYFNDDNAERAYNAEIKIRWQNRRNARVTGDWHGNRYIAGAEVAGKSRPYSVRFVVRNKRGGQRIFSSGWVQCKG